MAFENGHVARNIHVYKDFSIMNAVYIWIVNPVSLWLTILGLLLYMVILIVGSTICDCAIGLYSVTSLDQFLTYAILEMHPDLHNVSRVANHMTH